MNTTAERFRDAIAAAGLTPPVEILADGQLHRFSSNGKSGDDAGYYVLHDGGLPAGSFGCWRSGIKSTWTAKSTSRMTAKERAAHAKRIESIRQQRAADEKLRHAEAAERAEAIWNAAHPAPADHPYLLRKGVQAHGLRIGVDGRLILPISRNGAIASLEFISTDGEKQFLYGGAKRGGYFLLGNLDHSTPLLICEGFATGASLHEATSLPVAIAFDAGNVRPVARAIRATHPTTKIVLCADHDASGVGQRSAQAAADAVGGIVVIPDAEGDDWNDVAVRDGLEAVRRAITETRQEQPMMTISAASPNQVATFHIRQFEEEFKERDGAPLDDVHDYLGRFVAYPSSEAHTAHVLWVAHTHFMEHWESTPRMAFLSPEPGSGKTRALELTETLVPRPVEAINATPAYLFRKINDPDGLPTILFDEIDTIFGPRAREHEEIRGVINAGHRRGAMAGRCVVKGKEIMTEELPAFCAIAVAGLGNLPDTILTRSVIIRMRRRAPGEQVEPYRRRLHSPEGYRLRDRLAAWARSIGLRLNTSPAMPDGITDRSADVWESLLAVADAAGGNWPDLARVAAVALVASAKGGTPSLGIRLLQDLKTLFSSTDKMPTADICAGLAAMDEAPWGDLKGKPIDSHRLAGLLKQYGVESTQVKINGVNKKGYKREDLYDSWARYLPATESVCLPHIVEDTGATKATAPPGHSLLAPPQGVTPPARNETGEDLFDAAVTSQRKGADLDDDF